MASDQNGLWIPEALPTEERIIKAIENCHFLYGYNFNEPPYILSKIVFIRETLEDMVKEVKNVQSEHIDK